MNTPPALPPPAVVYRGPVLVDQATNMSGPDHAELQLRGVTALPKGPTWQEKLL